MKRHLIFKKDLKIFRACDIEFCIGLGDQSTLLISLAFFALIMFSDPGNTKDSRDGI